MATNYDEIAQDYKASKPTQSLEAMGDTRVYGFVKQSTGREAEGAEVQYTCYLDDGRTVP